MESSKSELEPGSILHQIEKDLQTIDKVLEENRIDKQQSVEEFIRTQRGDDDPLNQRQFI